MAVGNMDLGSNVVGIIDYWRVLLFGVLERAFGLVVCVGYRALLPDDILQGDGAIFRSERRLGG